MRFTKSRALLVLGAAALLLLLGLALRSGPISVEPAAVERGELVVTLDEEGETRAKELFVVSAPLSGRVLRVELEAGDPVVAGETVLVRFQPSDPALLDARSRAEATGAVRASEAALGRARALAAQAREELAFAESEVARYRQLASDGIVSDGRLESAELEVRTRAESLDAADFAVRNQEHELEVARARLLVSSPEGESSEAAGAIALRSPINGRVLRVVRESEAVVPAGEPLMEVADPGQLEIVADFLSTDAVRMKPGNAVLVERWGGEHVLAGSVERVEPFGFTKISALGVEEQRVNVIAELDETPPGLGHGYRVEVRVVISQVDDALKIPTGAVFRNGDDWATYVIENGRASLRVLEVGLRNDRFVEVLAGAAEDERVIIHPGDRVEDGVRVQDG